MIEPLACFTVVDTGRLRVLASGLRFPEGPVALADGGFVFDFQSFVVKLFKNYNIFTII